jgi:hypothetical protein
VTLKRPMGVGVVTAPIAAENDASGRDPCISQMRRSCRLVRIQVLVWTVRRPCRLIQPVLPFGFSGSTMRPQRRFVVVRSTHSQVGAPSGVAAGRRATVAPPGDERTVAPCGADTSRKRGPFEARACAGRTTASRASPTANIVLHRRTRRCSASNLSTHRPPSPRPVGFCRGADITSLLVVLQQTGCLQVGPGTARPLSWMPGGVRRWISLIYREYRDCRAPGTIFGVAFGRAVAQ